MHAHTNRLSTSGISLYTMLAAVVVLGVLGSVAVSRYDGSSSRVASATALVRNTAAAAQRFHLDTGCYPTNVTALMTRDAASTNNTCDRAISDARWHGPYIAPAKTVPRSQGDADTTADYPTVPIEALGPTAKLVVYGSSETPWVWIGNLPLKVFQQIGSDFPRPHLKNAGDRAIQYNYSGT